VAGTSFSQFAIASLQQAITTATPLFSFVLSPLRGGCSTASKRRDGRLALGSPAASTCSPLEGRPVGCAPRRRPLTATPQPAACSVDRHVQAAIPAQSPPHHTTSSPSPSRPRSAGPLPFTLRHSPPPPLGRHSHVPSGSSAASPHTLPSRCHPAPSPLSGLSSPRAFRPPWWRPDVQEVSFVQRRTSARTTSAGHCPSPMQEATMGCTQRPVSTGS